MADSIHIPGVLLLSLSLGYPAIWLDTTRHWGEGLVRQLLTTLNRSGERGCLAQ